MSCPFRRPTMALGLRTAHTSIPNNPTRATEIIKGTQGFGSLEGAACLSGAAHDSGLQRSAPQIASVRTRHRPRAEDCPFVRLQLKKSSRVIRLPAKVNALAVVIIYNDRIFLIPPMKSHTRTAFWEPGHQRSGALRENEVDRIRAW